MYYTVETHGVFKKQDFIKVAISSAVCKYSTRVSID